MKSPMGAGGHVRKPMSTLSPVIGIHTLSWGFPQKIQKPACIKP